MAASSDRFTVALLGYGTIGSALHRLLVEHREHIFHTTGRNVDVSCALVRDLRKPRDPAGALQLVDSVTQLLDTKPSLVCEAMGGLEPARTYVLQALERGIHVVTANKQLVATHGAELFAAAEAGGAQLRFEASVCAAIPVVQMMRESLAAARIESLAGILNGTTNFVLSKMRDEGASYDAALAEAQRLGFAEPDPTDDVSGIDAAAKLAILAGIAFHTRLSVTDVEVSGITDINPDDARFADTFGFRIKLVGMAQKLSDGGIRARVEPTLVPTEHPLAIVEGSLNAVEISGSPFDQIFLRGPGAGGPQTASALAGDIVGAMGSTPSFLTHDPAIGPARLTPTASVADRFYVRLRVSDKPGVLSQVAQRCAEHDVSIERLRQHRGPGSLASLAFITHPAPGAAVEAAIAAAGSDPESSVSIMPMLAANDKG